MPAKSHNQMVAAAIAKNNPSKLFARNRGLLGMSSSQLSDFASKPLASAIQRRKAKKS